MRDHVDEIADFTELGYYIDMPVRTYSAGMVIRLCFAVATAFPPEILLMDEWILAGDWSFCKRRESGWTFVAGSSVLVLASHAMPLLEEWCNRALLPEGGRIVAAGTVAEIAARHQGETAAP